MKVGEAKLNPLKILIYGPPGSGKTLLALSAGSVAQIFDLDLGVESALGQARKLPQDQIAQDRLLVDHIPIAEPDPINSATSFEKTKSYMIFAINAAAKGQYPYKVLIIDSFTTLADGAMKYVLRNTGRLIRPVSVEKGNITQPEWGLMINEIETIVQLIRGAPFHVILLAHSVPVKNDNGTIVKHEIAIPTQRLPPRVPAYFDELWYIHLEQGANNTIRRTIRTESSWLYEAKSRAGLKDGTDISIGLKEIFRQLGREL